MTIAGTGCWRLLVSPAAHAFGGPEVVARPDSNDTRMQQVTFANGKLWGALDTALNPDGGAQRAGIAWYIVNPSAGKLVLQGYLGATGHDFTYPAIGVTPSGRGIMAFTDTGDSTYPSAAYASIDANAGIGAWNDVPGGTGAAVDDGFSGYKQQNRAEPARARVGATTAPPRSTATRSGSPASTSLRRVTTRRGAGRSSSARPATTCSAPVPVGPSVPTAREPRIRPAREPR